MLLLQENMMNNKYRWKLILKQNFKAKKYCVFFWLKDYFTYNFLKMDRAALVGLPSAALGPQDIPHQRRVRPELDGTV